MTRRLLAAGLALSMFGGADAASAFIAANTIDRHATYDQEGARVRVTGPIGCTSGERIAIRVSVVQTATGAWARKTWQGRCTGQIQHWGARARAREGTRFETRTGRVCAVAKTLRASRVTDTRKWCRRVPVSAGF